jgi:predicted alpha/beta superfamily hydrolase
VLSPSVWWNGRAILAEVGSAHPVPRPRIWLDMGTAEGLRHLRDTDLLAHRLLARGWRAEGDGRGGVNLHYLRVHGALHNEESWARRFDQVLRFLFPARS